MTQLSPEIIALLDKWVPSVISAASVLGGVLIGAGLNSWFSSGRERKQRRHAFVDKQLSEFYSPMLGLRAEVKALSELRVKLQAEANAAWQQLCAEVAPGHASQALTAIRFPEFQALIEYDNKKLSERLLPSYRKMADLFRDKLWLCEEDTRNHYATLIEFIDIWDRWLKKSLPVEVLERIKHGEDKLNPLYEHLQQQHDKLRALIAKGEA